MAGEGDQQKYAMSQQEIPMEFATWIIWTWTISATQTNT